MVKDNHIGFNDLRGTFTAVSPYVTSPPHGVEMVVQNIATVSREHAIAANDLSRNFGDLWYTTAPL